jgi:hypothetical protein
MRHRHPALRPFRFVDLPSSDFGSDSDCEYFFESDGVFTEEPLQPRPNALSLRNCTDGGRRRVRKGEGAESKLNSPDQYDLYQYEMKSIAYARIVMMGYPNASLVQIVRIGELVEEQLRTAQVHTSPRNRAARRRKPNAYHWLDEHWQWMGLIPFDQIITSVLGIPLFGEKEILKH